MSVKKVFLLMVATFLMSFSFNVFFAPFNIIVSGSNGLGIIFNQLWGINPALVVFVINVVLIIVAYLVLGKEFAAKIFLGANIFIPLFLYIIPIHAVTEDVLLSVVFGSFVNGIAITLLFYSEGSAGGTTILASMINRFSSLAFSTALAICDSTVVFIGLFVFGPESTMYSLVAIVITRFIANFFETGLNRNHYLQIISNNYLVISQEISKNTDVGITLIDGYGGYSKQEFQIICCAVNVTQLKEIRDLVYSYDQDALMIVNQASTIYGKEFAHHRVKAKNKKIIISQ